MPQNITLLEARNLGRRRPGGSGWLLNDVSLAIDAGDILSLGGASGAGKTLLLRAIALLDPIDHGEVRWLGRRVRGDAAPPFAAAPSTCTSGRP